MIKQYVADNQSFTSDEWKTDYSNQNQDFHFLGVGAHHQNHSECAIYTIFNMPHAVLFYFAMNWPKAADMELWPFAINHTVYPWN